MVTVAITSLPIPTEEQIGALLADYSRCLSTGLIRNDASYSPEMKELLQERRDYLDQGEFPIASIVVLDDEIIAQATASEQREKRFLGHAELVALEEADKQQLSFVERGRARLFTNLEPCLMCMGAAMSFFLGQIVYGLESPGDGAVDLVRAWARKEEDIPGYQIPEITGGLLREESIRLFEAYVARREPGPMRDWAETLTRLR
jgi:tRNA(adenine34) deaminase